MRLLRRGGVEAHTDMLAAGRGELRKVLVEIVREAVARGWVDAGKAGWRSWRGDAC
jgi:hypothetical protein